MGPLDLGPDRVLELLVEVYAEEAVVVVIGICVVSRPIVSRWGWCLLRHRPCSVARSIIAFDARETVRSYSVVCEVLAFPDHQVQAMEVQEMQGRDLCQDQAMKVLAVLLLPYSPACPAPETIRRVRCNKIRASAETVRRVLRLCLGSFRTHALARHLR